MKKAVIYARYSSERQTEQSIEGQLSVCHKFAQENDFVILDEYIDRATTGTNDNRISFQKMIRDSARKEWQFVIVYKGDRFSRNRIESAIHKKTLRDNGVKLVSATENIPESPEGIILESLLEGMAEYYSAELSQKVKRGMNESKKKKQFTGGSYLYGWDVIDKKPIINEKEAAVVRSIYEDYIAGRTAKDIVARLNREGVVDKRGNKFKESNIYRMVGQAKYAGSDVYPAIITKEEREKVDKILEENKRAPARKKSVANFLLSGKLICGECGGYMTGDSGTSKTGAVHYYYKCFERKKHTRACSMPSIRKEEIENRVFEVCAEVLNNGFIPHVVEAAYKIHQDELSANIAVINLEAMLSEKEKAISNIMTAIEQGIFTATTKQRLLDLEKEVEEIRYRLVCEKENATHGLTKEDYHAFLSAFIGKQCDNEEFKQEVIDLLIREVVVFRDKICITFNYSPDNSKGKKRTYDAADIAEIEETLTAQSTPEGSVLFANGQPQTNNPNTIVFVKAEYWGVWIKRKR